MVLPKTKPAYCEKCICELLVKKRKEKVEIVAAAADYFGKKTDDILGKRRQHVYVKPRYFAIYYMVQKGYKTREIGKFFKKDRSLVTHAKNTIEDMFDCDKESKAQYNEFVNLLN